MEVKSVFKLPIILQFSLVFALLIKVGGKPALYEVYYTSYICSRRCPGFLLNAKASVLSDSGNATPYRIPDLYLGILQQLQC